MTKELTAEQELSLEAQREETTECIRCGQELMSDEVWIRAEQDYCENCYDDMFIGWEKAFKRKEE